MSDITNQRKHARLSANHVIRVWPVDGKKQDSEASRMVDVSEGGMCFTGPRYLPPGTLVSIEVAESRILAEVRHCQMRKYSAHMEFVTGVQVRQVLDGPDNWEALTRQPD
jgi:hypothetical protein